MEWCYVFGLDDVFVVMVGFDDCVQKVVDVDVMVVYFDWCVVVIGVDDGCVYGFGIFGVEIEDLFDFDVVCGVVVFFGNGFEQCCVMGFVGVGIVVGEFFQYGLILFYVVIVDLLVVEFQIGDFVVIEYFGFVGFGQYQEFMCIIVVDWVVIGVYWNGLQVYVFIVVQIVDQMLVIGMQCICVCQVEIIVVFYQEFVVVYYVEMWVDFVVEFLLDVIQCQWQIFVVVYM